MGSAESFEGCTFGHLTGIALVGHNKFGIRLWRWRCQCGAEIDRPSIHIKSGRQVSCGCHRNQKSRERITHGQSNTRTYKAWIRMKSRCRGSDETAIKHYVNRGIQVCAAWIDDFSAFLKDMGECPKGLTLERIRNADGYQPDNCKWATQGEQLRNTRRTVLVIFQGKQMCLKDACAAAGVNYHSIRSRIRANGISAQDALDMR